MLFGGIWVYDDGDCDEGGGGDGNPRAAPQVFIILAKPKFGRTIGLF